METWIGTRWSLIWINVKLYLRLIRFSQWVQNWFSFSSRGEGLECTVSSFCRVAVRKVANRSMWQCFPFHSWEVLCSPVSAQEALFRNMGLRECSWVGRRPNHAIVNAWSNQGILKLRQKWWQRDEKKVEKLVEEERLLYCTASTNRTWVHV